MTKALTRVPGWKQVSFNPLDGVSYSGHILIVDTRNLIMKFSTPGDLPPVRT